MKTGLCGATGIFALMFAAGHPGISATMPDAARVPVQMVVTVEPSQGGARAPVLEPGELTVLENRIRVPVTGAQRLTGDMAGMQLLVLLDDSTRSSSLGTQLPDLKRFVESLAATTEVSIGYMQNGRAVLTQPFTTDHHKAAAAVRLGNAIPGENGSPYFVLSDVVRHWPSAENATRRAVVMFTDGVDRYYTSSIVDDPYVDAAIHDAQKVGVMVYSVYLRGAGFYGRGSFSTNIAQSRLMEVSQETGGYAYFEGFTDPVTIQPFLRNLQQRLDNQYLVTIAARNEKGFQPIKVQSELPGLKLSAPAQIYVR